MENFAPVALYMAMDGLDVEPGKALLRAAGVEPVDLTEATPAGEIAGRVVALMAGYAPVGEELFAALPRLRVVATHSAGFDMVDRDAARRRGLWVCNLPGGASEEVATHAFAMALSLLRQLPALDRQVRENRWTDESAIMPRRLSTLTCGVIGLGQIGRRFAGLAAGCFGRVAGYDPALPDEAWPGGVRRLDLDELLRVSDCVSLHLPLTAATRHLLDARRIASLPRRAVVVNASRGGLIDEAALVAALRSGLLDGVACDVLAQEPPGTDDPMLSAPRVLLSPHAGYLSVESLRDYAEVPARNVLSLLRTGRADNAVVVPVQD